ncbi:ABC transporter substrate-binding protein [Candidatus Bipolaricaulota bacterium]|nr:ABC transporter substrate-binding protein [Candidatus Bipolaricaulota bacterium]
MRVCAVVIAVLAVALGAGAEVTVVDHAGRTVVVPLPPSRVASAFGVATAYVYALGAGDLLVGARYLGLPESPLGVEVMERIDPAFEGKAFPGEVSVEVPVALGADLVFVGRKHLPLADQLADVGIPAVVLQPESFPEVREAILLTGDLLGRGERAEGLAAFYDAILAAVAAEGVLGEDRPTVLLVGTSPGRVAGGGMYQTGLVHLAGGASVSQDLPGSWQDVGPEQILLWDPEVIVIAPYGPVTPGDFLDEPLFQGLRAVREGRVYKMPQLLFAWDTPIPESVLGVLWLAELLHPGRVPLDFAAVATRFYREFYGVELQPAELDLLGGR